MFSRCLRALGAATLGSLLSVAPIRAQHLDRVRLTFPMGPSVLVPGSRFGEAYDGGVGAGASVTFPVSRRVRLRAGFEFQTFPYDRLRFFQRLGIDQVDLEGQFGEGARIWSWSLGPEVVLWDPGTVALYSTVLVGRASRQSTGMLVWMYCAPKTVLAVVGDTLRSVPYVPPASCPEATSETAIAGSGFGAQVGAGIRVRDRGRSFWVLEVGVATWLLAPRMLTFPVRVGYGLGF
jgi:hypothetical protein